MRVGGGSRQLSTSGHELLVYEFAPTDGPGAAAAFDHLREVWTRCTAALLMGSPIPGLGLPARLPVTAEELIPGDGMLAAQERPTEDPGGDVYQAVLYRTHDLLCLTVMMAPADERPSSEPDDSWPRLGERWGSIAGDLPAAMVGAARVWQGHVHGPDHACGTAWGELAALYLDVLSTRNGTPVREQHGIATRGGLMLWEQSTGDDDRAKREFLVFAAQDKDRELSTYTWQRNDLAMPALARYLAHAAKVRYQRRVWAGGDQARMLINQVSAQAHDLILRVEAGLSDPKPPPHDDHLHAHARRLEVGLARLASLASEFADLDRSIEIAAWNMRAVLREDVDTDVQTGPFIDDLALTEHFAVQISDDRGYLDEAIQRARQALAIVPPLLPPPSGQGAVGGPGPPLVPVTEPEAIPARQRCCEVMARLFTSRTARSQLLERIGVSRDRLPEIGAGNSREWWWEVLAELDKGIIVDPYSRLVTAALNFYPGNPELGRLAAEYGVGSPDGR